MPGMNPWAAMRYVFCRMFCPCDHKPDRGRTRVKLRLQMAGFLPIEFTGDFMATVVKTGGPLKMDVSGFVDDKGNPVTYTDPATYSSSNEAIATVANDPADPQDGIITLTGAVTPPGESVVITAAFKAQLGGKDFAVVGNLIVIEPAAASAQAVITGPGVVEGA